MHLLVLLITEQDVQQQQAETQFFIGDRDGILYLLEASLNYYRR